MVYKLNASNKPGLVGIEKNVSLFHTLNAYEKWLNNATDERQLLG